ncbi:MAG: hypothetical protein ACREI8_13070 [Myxococcota bacterium]
MKTRDELVAIALAHAQSESGNDIELTLSTLEPDPVYELQPVGRVLRGMPAARRYYEHFFASFRPLVRGFELRGEWVSEGGVGQEYVIQLHTPERGDEQHHVIGILTFGRQALSGERVYASERLLRLMFGPAYELSVPL